MLQCCARLFLWNTWIPNFTNRALERFVSFWMAMQWLQALLKVVKELANHASASLCGWLMFVCIFILINPSDIKAEISLKSLSYTLSTLVIAWIGCSVNFHCFVSQLNAWYSFWVSSSIICALILFIIPRKVLSIGRRSLIFLLSRAGRFELCFRIDFSDFFSCIPERVRGLWKKKKNEVVLITL